MQQCKLSSELPVSMLKCFLKGIVTQK